MYETVTVTKVINKETIQVACASSACNGCKGETFCNKKGKDFEANNRKALALEPGMQVELFLKPSRTIAGTLITLIFPLMLFPIGYYIASALSNSEIVGMFSGLAGIGIGFLAAWAYFRAKRHQYLPQVDHIVEEDGEQ
ncbi:Positive regulator of sigma E activity [Sphaerochaeta pleomorpha str. Grapes]|uniref:Positive regulator of sigma E activity n=1 Tax=Sphaerochaeta pleomorpha (strain ATCC BAA-1885 / DSM 22778 / Grapes) TaxID=158190 RepID=G8QT74_SPHPG|nr:SoxR reducing system RseC family protein [Sphaerochaeta pleomorpha]AEV29041.1 Positive regulator of sigma E activity [Sphaerochaeta pleomorpha str. Grapes]